MICEEQRKAGDARSKIIDKDFYVNLVLNFASFTSNSDFITDVEGNKQEGKIPKTRCYSIDLNRCHSNRDKNWPTDYYSAYERGQLLVETNYIHFNTYPQKFNW